MTNEEIFKLAITCGLDEFVNEPLLKFARAMYEKGKEIGYWEGYEDDELTKLERLIAEEIQND